MGGETGRDESRDWEGGQGLGRMRETEVGGSEREEAGEAGWGVKGSAGRGAGGRGWS